MQLDDNLIHQDANGFPSVVKYCTKDGETTVYACNVAKRKKSSKKESVCVVNCVKRMIGLSYKEFMELNDHSVFGNCKVFEKNGIPYFKISPNDTEGKNGVEVASEIFKVIKKVADSRLDCSGKIDCYVTVPANYKENQRDAIIAAAAMADLTVQGIFTEPTAAAMSWCHEESNRKTLKHDTKMLIFDFGGGTLDLSVIRYCKEGDKFDVMTTGGNPRLGGEDVNVLVSNYFTRTYGDKIPKKYREKGKKHPEFLRECEEAKIQLSHKELVEFTIIDENAEDDEGEIKFDITLAALNQEINVHMKDKIKRCILSLLLDQVISNCHLSPSVISHIFMVGGSSQLQGVRDIIRDIFPASTKIHVDDINPVSCVAMGALHQAEGFRNGSGSCKFTECVNFSYGLLSGNKAAILLHKNTAIPSRGPEIRFATCIDFPEYIESKVYQFDKSYIDAIDENGNATARISEGKIVRGYKFKNPFPKPKGKQQFIIQFSIAYGGTLTVVCKDADSSEVLNCTDYTNLVHRE